MRVAPLPIEEFICIRKYLYSNKLIEGYIDTMFGKSSKLTGVASKSKLRWKSLSVKVGYWKKLS